VVHRSLHEQRLLMGAPYGLAVMNLTTSVAMVVILGIWLYAGVAIAFHILSVWTGKRDPHLLAVYLRYVRQDDVYDPWPRSAQKQGARPEGFGRGLLC
jgi:type IV secretion system protein VirB3